MDQTGKVNRKGGITTEGTGEQIASLKYKDLHSAALPVPA